MVTLAQTHHQASSIVLGQLQSPQCSGRLAHQQSITVVHPGHYQGQHNLGAGVPVQEASDGAQVIKCGALDTLDLAMHIHGGFHDDTKVAEGGQYMHTDSANTHSRLQHSVGGLVVRSHDDHELCLVAGDLLLVGEHPDSDLLDTPLQPL